jgi:gamma-glutamyl-gamma-aminobutyraldehyde dehydrogenase
MTTEQMAALSRDDFHRMAAELKPETRMFIDGKFVNAKSGQQFETINPANDEAIANVPLGGPEDVDLAVASCRRAFKSGAWSRMEPRARASVMYRFADLIEQHCLELGLLESIDVGKPVQEVIGANGDVRPL